jgi:hypothetical protein
MSANGQCEHIKPDGRRCQARAVAGSRWCFFHDPAKAEARKNASRSGGKRSHRPAATLPAGAADAPLKTVGDVVNLLAETISQVRKGAIDTRIANAVGYLGSVLLRALEGDELARQVEELRRQVDEVTHERSCITPAAGASKASAGVQKDGGADHGDDPGGPVADHGAGVDEAGPVAGGIDPLFG